MRWFRCKSLDPIYVNFSVPQQDAERTPVGRNVRITTADSTDLEFAGQVTAINSVVDEATRNVQVQATLANPQNKLRPGMFVQTEVDLGMSHPIVPVPASAINYAPYGDSVFVVADLTRPEWSNLPGRTPAGCETRPVAR